jgi:hypothetical protein
MNPDNSHIGNISFTFDPKLSVDNRNDNMEDVLSTFKQSCEKQNKIQMTNSYSSLCRLYYQNRSEELQTKIENIVREWQCDLAGIIMPDASFKTEKDRVIYATALGLASHLHLFKFYMSDCSNFTNFTFDIKCSDEVIEAVVETAQFGKTDLAEKLPLLQFPELLDKLFFFQADEDTLNLIEKLLINRVDITQSYEWYWYGEKFSLIELQRHCLDLLETQELSLEQLIAIWSHAKKNNNRLREVHYQRKLLALIGSDEKKLLELMFSKSRLTSLFKAYFLDFSVKSLRKCILNDRIPFGPEHALHLLPIFKMFADHKLYTFVFSLIDFEISDEDCFTGAVSGMLPQLEISTYLNKKEIQGFCHWKLQSRLKNFIEEKLSNNQKSGLRQQNSVEDKWTSFLINIAPRAEILYQSYVNLLSDTDRNELKSHFSKNVTKTKNDTPMPPQRLPISIGVHRSNIQNTLEKVE